ncbi:ATP-binding cassette domain-containing protein, partial [Pseudoalteromonas nigrifaciens]
MLCANNVSAQIGQKKLLKHINFYVKPNELVVIIGPNGAGKSSLLKALCGDIKINNGDITLNDRLLSDYSIASLATLRAVLTQNYELDFPFSVAEVVDMAHFAHQADYSKQQLM